MKEKHPFNRELVPDSVQYSAPAIVMIYIHKKALQTLNNLSAEKIRSTSSLFQVFIRWQTGPRNRWA
jgi:hypothetical protein